MCFRIRVQKPGLKVLGPILDVCLWLFFGRGSADQGTLARTPTPSCHVGCQKLYHGLERGRRRGEGSLLFGESRRGRGSLLFILTRPALGGGMDWWRMEWPFSRVRKYFSEAEICRKIPEIPQKERFSPNFRLRNLKFQSPKKCDSIPLATSYPH